jgi:general secretion pathway protein I
VKARGFTLVEVLVALVIVAAGAAAVLASLNSAATSTTYLREKTFAQWIAGNRMTETRLETTTPRNGTTDGDLEYAGQRWQWHQVVADSQLPGLRRIDISVRPLAVGASTANDGSTAWTYTLAAVMGRDVAPASGTEPEWEPLPDAGAAGKDGAKDPAGRTPGAGATPAPATTPAPTAGGT